MKAQGLGLAARTEGTYRSVLSYAEVLKPRSSLLLVFIGVATGFVAGGGAVSPRLLLSLLAILVASAGANGLTNYLDCGIDARMQRTRHRALPSKRIDPPEKVLPLNLGLIGVGLALAWLLHPLVFAADLLGTVSAAAWRKRWTCVFPQGVLASCAPVLMGWFAFAPTFSLEILLLCLLIGMWVPVHVWSVMVGHREDYLHAGLDYFPMSRAPHDAVKVLLAFSVALWGAAIALYFAGGFGWLYLALANALSLIMVVAAARLLVSKAAGDAWRLYKLSSFPYLGLVFLAMCLDVWLRG